LIFEFASCNLHDQHSIADYISETLLAFWDLKTLRYSFNRNQYRPPT